MRSAHAIALLAGIVGVALIASVVFVLTSPPTTPPAPMGQPTVEVTLYGGEIVEGGTIKFGFGLSKDEITTPGPTLRFKVGDVVKITFIVAGDIPHTFAIVGEPEEGARVLFNAKIGSPTNPILPGDEGSIVFKAEKAGTFYYICTIPGHVLRGMFGKIEISPP